MLVYSVISFIDNLPSNTRSFVIRKKPLDGDDEDMDMVLMIRDFDYRFAFFRGVTHRVCQAEFDEDDNDTPFVRVWITDPFAGYEGYEQIDKPVVNDDYCI